jgi:hypothetical protein
MKLLFVFFVAILALPALAANGALQPTRLQCEHATEPVAVDVTQPRLSWQSTAASIDTRGLQQTAYQIQVASSRERLLHKADLWDSGKIKSDASHLVQYLGSPLTSRQDAYWRVRVWDNNNKASSWSPIAHFKLAVLKPEDWQAKWITDPKPADHVLQADIWVWHGSPDSMRRFVPGTYYFRKKFELTAQVAIRSAVMAISCDDRFSLYVNGHEAMYGQDGEVTLQADICDFLQKGENILAIAAVNGGRQPNVAGLIGHLSITFADDTRLDVAIDNTWKSSARETLNWKNLNGSDQDWRPVHSLGPFGMAPWGNNSVLPVSLPIFRKSTELAKPAKRALLYICGLGQYEAIINGRRVGDQVMAPGWTQYKKSCLYDTYDVTSLLQSGENVVAVLLGNGMFNVQGGRYIKYRGSFGAPQLILQLEVEHPDGSLTTIVSDQTWKTAPGPITFSCIYGGEDVDLRLEPAGWSSPGFNDQDWQSAHICPGPGGVLSSSMAPPIRVMETFKAVNISNPKPGVYIYDLGQNFSGWPEILLSGSAGRRVRLTPGELLDEQGLVSQKSSGTPVYFSLITNGEARERWAPRFSYYGFRYVQLEGAVPATFARPGDPVIVHDVQGQFFHADAERVGDFSCTNPLINKIHQLILSAIRSNLQSVLTDCPHREKLGWLEVSHLLHCGMAYNFYLPEFYAKIEQDMKESQLANGLIPDIAPEFTVFSQGFRDSPEWGSAAVFNPWYVAEMNGDDQLVRDYYPEMKRYVDYLSTTAKDNIVSHGLGDWYDIGPGSPGQSQLTSTGLTATAIYYGDLCVVAETARKLHNIKDAEFYSAKAEQVRKAFNARFFHPDSNRYDRGSQTAQAMPLVLNMVDPDKRQVVADSLAALVRRNGTRVTAGDVGFMFLVRALTDAGHDDVLYDLVCQEEGPGYAEQLRKNATSLTEAWDANPASSQNHCMLGHAEEWFYTGLAGIRPNPARPGFKQVRIKPAFIASLQGVHAHYDGPYGRINVEWQRYGNEIELKVAIPPNSSGRIYMPQLDLAAISESSQPIRLQNGIQKTGIEQTHRCFDVGSGQFVFRFKAQSPSHKF